ncbi:hypothetical protein CHELA20_11398 [Hyphomicrobiales bacterium]|nr:hypothetical protein CHELA20_11398 [Hyphomicrobiales bacterium]CAH1695783.1 hypothetical protein CHELA41_51645 [Hyphomicrobiales bacterium]
MKHVKRLDEEKTLVPASLHYLQLGQQHQSCTDRRPRDPEQITQLLLAQMVTRLKLRVANEIEYLVRESVPALV